MLEKEIAGFGASGRNGGWCSALFPRSTASLERAHGRDAALAMRRAMVDTVDEVGRAAAAAGIDCDYAKGGTIAYARSAVQLARRAGRGRRGARVRRRRARAVGRRARAGRGRARGVVRSGLRARASGQARARARRRRRGARVRRSPSRPRCSTGSPGRVDDHARHRHRRPHRASPPRATARRCAQTHRRILPLYSLMIATEPLPDAFWDEIGIEHGQTFTDYRHLLIYGQRTADNRFAFGGRGARYHWGSAIRPEYDRVAARLRAPASARCATCSPSIGGCRGHPPLGRPARRSARLARERRPTTPRRGSRAPAATSATA